MMKVSDRCLGSLSLVTKKPYLGMNLTVLSHKMKEDEEASSFKLTTDYGLYHEGSVVGSVSKFSSSSFFPKRMVTWQHPWESKHTQLGSK